MMLFPKKENCRIYEPHRSTASTGCVCVCVCDVCDSQVLTLCISRSIGQIPVELFCCTCLSRLESLLVITNSSFFFSFK